MTIDVGALRARYREQWEALRAQQDGDASALLAHVDDGLALLDALDGAQAEVARLHAVVTEQVVRISWLLDERGGAAHDAGYVARVEAARDAAEARIEQQDSLIMWQGKALDAEREKVRMLREALEALAAGSVLVQRQWFRDHGMPEVADRTEAYAHALARAALAAADALAGGGA